MTPSLPRIAPLGALVALALATAPAAFAQKEVNGGTKQDPLNWRASAVYGTVQLTHGFSPDPTRAHRECRRQHA